MAKRAQIDAVRPILNEVNDGVSKVEGVLDAVEAGADKAADALESGLEKVADVVPEVLDKGVHVVAEGTRRGVRVFQNPRALILTTTLAGAIIGAGLGVAAYFLQKKAIEKKLRAEMEAELEKQIEGMRLFYEKRATPKQPFSSPEEAAKTLIKPSAEEVLVSDAVRALNEYEGDQPPPGIISEEDDPRQGANQRVRYDKAIKRGPVIPASETAVQESKDNAAALEEVVKNVFVEHADLDGWHQEAEESVRNPMSPYIISHDEYMENAYEHEQNSLTYYQGDDILADEREVHIDEVEATIGMQNMRFGHGSRDSNIVYVRNERLEVDFEVTLNEGKYVDAVETFLEHSDTPRIRHGRKGDDG